MSDNASPLWRHGDHSGLGTGGGRQNEATTLYIYRAGEWFTLTKASTVVYQLEIR